MNKTIDPVCKMEVNSETAKYTAQYNGTTYYFCAPGCKKAFEKEPETYLAENLESDHEHHNH